MKRILTLFLLLYLVGSSLLAQDRSLQVVYITKDYSTRVNQLCAELKDIYEFAKKDKSYAVVFYMANSDNPTIVKMNLKGDNRRDIDRIFSDLVTKTETMISPYDDLKYLIKLFDDIPLFSADGGRLFSEVDVRFYVTPTFWDLDYNEQIIAPFFMAMDLDSPESAGYASISIYHSSDDGLAGNQDRPFGVYDLSKNYNLLLLTY